MKETDEQNNRTDELGKDVNRCHFVLVTHSNAKPEDYGWTKEFVDDMLYIEANEPEHEWMSDHEILNNLGILFCDGVGTNIDMERAIKYYGKAAEMGDDLAKSNLADIYRKGKNGVKKDLKKAFELYLSCHIPYAYYRVGEALEFGRGVERDIEKAKQYYRVAYREGHPLARRKLQTLNFLE